jgi:hypothetical protein
VQQSGQPLQHLSPQQLALQQPSVLQQLVQFDDDALAFV